MQVARRLRHEFAARLVDDDVTPSQARALGVVARHEPLRLSSLAEHLRIAPRSATEVVDALEQRGVVRREADPADRRATLIRLTAEGARVRGRIGAARRRAGDDLLGVLSDVERDALVGLLSRLVAD